MPDGLDYLLWRHELADGEVTTLYRRHLLNRPYSTQDQPAPESRPIVSALVFERRGPP